MILEILGTSWQDEFFFSRDDEASVMSYRFRSGKNPLISAEQRAHTTFLYGKEHYDLAIANPSASLPLDLFSPPTSDPSPHQRFPARFPEWPQFIPQVNRRIHASLFHVIWHCVRPSYGVR